MPFESYDAEQQKMFASAEFRPLLSEIESTEFRVEGEVPKHLSGAYVRNGPNRIFELPGRDSSFIDGDAMLHGLWLEGGKPQVFRSRFVRTARFGHELDEGRALYRSASDLNWRDLAKGLRDDPRGLMKAAYGVLFKDASPEALFNSKHPVNVSLHQHAQKLFVMGDMSMPFEVDAQLNSVGPLDFAHRAKTASFSPHPRIDPQSNTVHMCGINLVPPHLRYFEFDQRGGILAEAHIDLGISRFVHDFGVSDTHIAFHSSPAVYSLKAFLTGDLVEWRPKGASHLLLMERASLRKGRTPAIKRIELETMLLSHWVNMFTEGNSVIIDAISYAELPIVCGPRRSFFGRRVSLPRLMRITVDTRTGKLSTETLARGVDLPRIHDDYSTRKHRYAYFTLLPHENERVTLAGGHMGFLKYDYQTGTSEVVEADPDMRNGEVLFVPDPSATAEDAGHLLSYVFDRESEQSALVIWNAQDVHSGPVARIWLPRRIPFGFHAAWVPA